MTTLRELDVSFNKIRVLIHDRLHRMLGLRTLDARNNRLQSLPAEFLPPNIQYLNAARNAVSVFPQSVCGAKHLQHLDLNHNMIQTIPPETAYCTSLTTLDLRYGQL